jgi:hypothetical protein
MENVRGPCYLKYKERVSKKTWAILSLTFIVNLIFALTLGITHFEEIIAGNFIVYVLQVGGFALLTGILALSVIALIADAEFRVYTNRIRDGDDNGLTNEQFKFPYLQEEIKTIRGIQKAHLYI